MEEQKQMTEIKTEKKKKSMVDRKIQLVKDGKLKKVDFLIWCIAHEKEVIENTKSPKEKKQVELILSIAKKALKR